MKLEMIEIASDYERECYFCNNLAKYVIGSHFAERNLFICNECKENLIKIGR